MSENTTKPIDADPAVDETVEKKKKKDKKKKDKDDKKEETAEPEQDGEDDDEKKEKKKKKKEKKDKKDKAEKGDEEEAAAEDEDEKKEKKKKKKEKKEKKQQDEEEGEKDETEAADGKAEKTEDNSKENQPQDQLEDCDFLIVDFSSPAAKSVKKVVWNVESLLEKVITDIMRVQPIKEKEDENLNKQIDLKNVDSHLPFEYEFMLKRISDQIQQPQTKTAFKLIEPKCARTSTKSSWVNFGKQAEAMERDPNHVLGFFKFELGCNGTIGSDNMLILNGGYQQKHFIKIIKKYIEIYVKCDVCNGYESTIEKDTKTRLECLKCANCGATRTVPTISKTYEARRRGERRRDRQ